MSTSSWASIPNGASRVWERWECPEELLECPEEHLECEGEHLEWQEEHLVSPEEHLECPEKQLEHQEEHWECQEEYLECQGEHLERQEAPFTCSCTYLHAVSCYFDVFRCIYVSQSGPQGGVLKSGLSAVVGGCRPLSAVVGRCRPFVVSSTPRMWKHAHPVYFVEGDIDSNTPLYPEGVGGYIYIYILFI